MSQNSLLLGLTGGIATGKSSVARMLADRGAPVIDADIVSRDLCVPGAPLLAALVERFGADILDAGGRLDRALLGRRVFQQPAELEALNSLTHPAIWKEILGRVAEARLRHRVVVLMAPLLLEHGAEAIVDQVWVVALPEALQVQRLMDREGFAREEALRRVRSQMPTEEKSLRADVVIDNGGTLAETEARVAAAWAEWVAPLLERSSPP